MRGYPQFSFRFLITPATIFYPRIFINRAKNTFELVGTVLKKSEPLGSSRDVQNVCAVAKVGTVLN